MKKREEAEKRRQEEILLRQTQEKTASPTGSGRQRYVLINKNKFGLQLLILIVFVLNYRHQTGSVKEISLEVTEKLNLYRSQKLNEQVIFNLFFTFCSTKTINLIVHVYCFMFNFTLT